MSSGTTPWRLWVISWVMHSLTPIHQLHSRSTNTPISGKTRLDDITTSNQEMNGMPNASHHRSGNRTDILPNKTSTINSMGVATASMRCMVTSKVLVLIQVTSINSLDSLVCKIDCANGVPMSWKRSTSCLAYRSRCLTSMASAWTKLFRPLLMQWLIFQLTRENVHDGWAKTTS